MFSVDLHLPERRQIEIVGQFDEALDAGMRLYISEMVGRFGLYKLGHTLTEEGSKLTFANAIDSAFHQTPAHIAVLAFASVDNPLKPENPLIEITSVSGNLYNQFNYLSADGAHLPLQRITYDHWTRTEVDEQAFDRLAPYLTPPHEPAIVARHP